METWAGSCRVARPGWDAVWARSVHICKGVKRQRLERRGGPRGRGREAEAERQRDRESGETEASPPAKDAASSVVFGARRRDESSTSEVRRVLAGRRRSQCSARHWPCQARLHPRRIHTAHTQLGGSSASQETSAASRFLRVERRAKLISRRWAMAVVSTSILFLSLVETRPSIIGSW